MLQDWVKYVPAIHYTGYFIAFLAAFLEALPGIGLIIPGQTIIAVAGFLAGSHVLVWWLVAVMAIMGAIIGDMLGYWLGRRYGLNLLNAKRGMVADAMSLVRRHPFKTLVFGRFNSLTRAFAPFAAGASKLRLRTFMVANVIGGILWGLTWTGIGLLFGASYALVSHSAERVIFVAVVLAAGLFLLYYLLKRRYGVGGLAFMLVLTASCTLIAFAAIISGINGPTLHALDGIVAGLIPHPLPAPLLVLSLTLTALMDPISIVFICSVVFGTLLLARKTRRAFVFLSGAVGGVVLLMLVKDIVERARPSIATAWAVTTGHGGLSTYSFPSGHTLLAVVIFGSIVLIARHWLRPRSLFTLLCATLAIGVGASRIILGVHYFSDVLAGAVLGLFWLSMVFLVDEGLRARASTMRAPLKPAQKTDKRG